MQREQLLYLFATADRCESLRRGRHARLAEKKMRAAQKVTTDFVLEDSFLITNVGRFAPRSFAKSYDYGAILRACAAVCAADLVVWR